MRRSQSARSATSTALPRTKDRRWQTSSLGRKHPCSSPQLCSFWIHWQSSASVLRPGTRLSCRVSARITSIPRWSSTSNIGIQYTPVLSNATDVTPNCWSHAAISCRSGVVAPNTRISVPPSLVGAHT
jgi:hypothetical protein